MHIGDNPNHYASAGYGAAVRGGILGKLLILFMQAFGGRQRAGPGVKKTWSGFLNRILRPLLLELLPASRASGQMGMT
jgi:hypothetical protein